MLKRKQKDVARHFSLSPVADDILYNLTEKRLINNASEFIETLILKYGPVMLQHSQEVHETNILIPESDLIRQKSAEENTAEEYEKLDESQKKELRRLMEFQQENEFILNKDQELYKKFKERGLMK